MARAYVADRFRYLLKADDDSTICLTNLCTELGRLPPDRDVYLGKMKPNNRVSLDPTMRQYNPRFVNETGLSVYPRYAGGAGYVVSYTVAQALAAKVITARSPLPFRHFPREDATFGLWMSGIVGERSGITSIRDKRWLLDHPLPSRR